MTTTPVAGATSTASAPVVGGRPQTIAHAVTMAALVIVILDAVVGILPVSSVVWVLTPVRLVLMTGLAAALVAAPDPRSWLTWLDLPVLLLVVAFAGSALISGQGWPVWRALLTGVAGYYLAAVLVRRHPSAWAPVSLTALLTTGVAALSALHQWAHEVPTGFCRAGLLAARESCSDPAAMIRVTGTFANPNLLAAALVLLAPVAWAAARTFSSSGARLVGQLVVLAAAVALVMTWSRAGLAAGVVVTALVLAMRPGLRRSRVALVGGGALLALAAVALVGGSLGVRRDVWGAALRLAAGHPMGVGPGRAGALIDGQIAGGEKFRHAHDLWLNWLVEGGWASGAAMLLLTVGALVLVVRGAREGSMVARAVGAGLAGFALMSLVDHPANAASIAMLMWVWLGLLAGHRARGGHEQPASTDQGRRRAA